MTSDNRKGGWMMLVNGERPRLKRHLGLYSERAFADFVAELAAMPNMRAHDFQLDVFCWRYRALSPEQISSCWVQATRMSQHRFGQWYLACELADDMVRVVPIDLEETRRMRAGKREVR